MIKEEKPINYEYWIYKYLINTDLEDSHLREVQEFLERGLEKYECCEENLFYSIILTIYSIMNQFDIDKPPTIKEIISAIEKAINESLECDICEDNLADTYFDISLGWFTSYIKENNEYPQFNRNKMLVCINCKHALDKLAFMKVIKLDEYGILSQNIHRGK